MEYLELIEGAFNQDVDILFNEHFVSRLREEIIKERDAFNFEQDKQRVSKINLDRLAVNKRFMDVLQELRFSK